MSTEHTLIRVDGARTKLVPGALVPTLTAPGEVSLLASRALLLAGDEVRLTVEIAAGSRLLLRDVAAMVAYDGRGGRASYDVHLVVAEGACLVWDTQPLVLSDGADVRRSLTAECAEGGRLLIRDTVVLGRSGQVGGHLICRTRISAGGRPAVAEDLDLPDDGVGVLAVSRGIDTATAIGWRPVGTGASRFELEAPGVIERDLVVDAHRSAVGPVWRGWCAEMLVPGATSARRTVP